MPLKFDIDKVIANQARQISGDVVVDEYIHTSSQKELDKIRRREDTIEAGDYAVRIL